MTAGRSSRNRDFAGDVRQIVSQSLARRHPNIPVVARELGMSPRTLQRRLGDVGLTYARLVAQARADLARQMLGEPGPKIGEIARSVGYSDAGHFTRAFLRWTGLTPREFRRLRQDRARRVPRSRARRVPIRPRG